MYEHHWGVFKLVRSFGTTLSNGCCQIIIIISLLAPCIVDKNDNVINLAMTGTLKNNNEEEFASVKKLTDERES